MLAETLKIGCLELNTCMLLLSFQLTVTVCGFIGMHMLWFTGREQMTAMWITFLLLLLYVGSRSPARVIGLCARALPTQPSPELQ